MKTTRFAIALTLLGAAAVPGAAGVVYEIEVTDHSGSEPATSTTEASIEGKNLKMDIPAGTGGEAGGTAIYRGDRRELVVVDDADRSYMVIDEETMRGIAGAVGGAMSQIEEALKNVPEDQRAMVEEMMRQRMPQPPVERQRPDVRRTGDTATRNGYPCVRYEVREGSALVREHWVTDWKNIEGGAEAAEAFLDMAAFFRELMDTAAAAGGGLLQQAPGAAFDGFEELNGFPVVTREFGGDGELDSESTLLAGRRRTLDPAEFEPPAGYKRRSMMPQ